MALNYDGINASHTRLFRWTAVYAPELEKRQRPHLRRSNGSWRANETSIKVRRRWMYFYRAVESAGQMIDFLLSTTRDAAAAKRFFRRAVAQPHSTNPRTLTVEGRRLSWCLNRVDAGGCTLALLEGASCEILQQYR